MTRTDARRVSRSCDARTNAAGSEERMSCMEAQEWRAELSSMAEHVPAHGHRTPAFVPAEHHTARTARARMRGATQPIGGARELVAGASAEGGRASSGGAETSARYRPTADGPVSTRVTIASDISGDDVVATRTRWSASCGLAASPDETVSSSVPSATVSACGSAIASDDGACAAALCSRRWSSPCASLTPVSARTPRTANSAIARLRRPIGRGTGGKVTGDCRADHPPPFRPGSFHA